MISRRSILLTFAIATLFGGGLPVLAGSRRINPIRMFDTDNDGTLDLAEVKKAASACSRDWTAIMTALSTSASWQGD